jgi:hypothetical protein
VIAAKNEASGTIKQVSKDLKSMQNNSSSSGGSGAVFGGLPTQAAIIGTVVALGAVANQAAQSAAEFERLKNGTDALGKQYNLTSNDILSAIDNITQGTLSNTSILQQANQAMLLGVADTADEFETLAKIAVDRGRKMGIGIEKAFSSIVLGVGRLSPLILDNLGIVIDADNTYKAYAETINKTASNLNDFEKRQALLAKLKSEVANFDTTQVLDNASAWERFDAAIRNLAVSAGGLLNDWGVIVNIVNAVSTTLNNTAILINTDTAEDEITSLKKSIQLLEEEKKKLDSTPLLQQATDPTMALQFWNQLIGGADLYQTKIDELRAQIATIESGMKGVTSATEKAADSSAAQAEEATKVAILSERLNSLVGDLSKEYGYTKTATEEWKNSLIDSEGSLEGAIAKATELTAQMYAASQAAAAMNSALGGALGALQSAAVEAYRNTGGSLEVVAVYEQQRAALNDTLALAQELGITQSQLPFFMADAEDAATGYFDAINEAAKVTTKTGSATKQLTEEFRNLQSSVSGIFSDMFSDIGGVKVDDFLPREDAPNEAARRIADVMVKGFESPWADYFKTSFPDLFTKYMGEAGGDVKTAAGLLLRDFQSGLRPELIDTNVVKELAKRAFQVDQSTKAMIDQISRELADELGISIEEATGYASGAAGGAGLISKEAITKTNSELKFKPEFDMSNTKNDLLAAGKSAGLFNEAGNIMIEASVSITSVDIDTSTLGVVGIPTVPIVTGTPTTNAQKVLDMIGTVSTPVYLDYSTINGSPDAATNIETLIGNVEVPVYLGVPTTESVQTWINNITGQVGSIGIAVNAVPPADLSTVGPAFSPVYTEIHNALTARVPFTATDMLSILTKTFADNVTQTQMIGLNLGINMYQGFAQYPLGAVLAGELSRQVDEAQKSFENSGKNAGRKWGDAFLDVVGENVPIELLNILTDLITPEVQARLAGEGTR